MPIKHEDSGAKLETLVAVRFPVGMMELIRQAVIQSKSKSLSDYIRKAVVTDAERRTSYEEEPF